MEIILLLVIIVLELLIIYFVYGNRQIKTFTFTYLTQKLQIQSGEMVSFKTEVGQQKREFYLSDPNIIPNVKQDGNYYLICFVMPNFDVELFERNVDDMLIGVALTENSDESLKATDPFKQTLRLTVDSDITSLIIYRLDLTSIDDNGQPIFNREIIRQYDNCNKGKQYLLAMDFSDNYGISVVTKLEIVNYYLIFDKSNHSVSLQEYGD